MHIGRVTIHKINLLSKGKEMVANNKKTTKPAPHDKGFKKGASGNPNGRPKRTAEELDLIQACKDKTPRALDVMVHIMEAGENERNKLTAALAIIDRGYGKAVQPIDADVKGTLTVEIVKFGDK